MQEKQISSLLIGNRNTSKKTARENLISRKQNISKSLIGNLIDTDKDKVPDRFDCNPYNKNEQGVLDTIKRIISPLLPKPKPKTVTPEQGMAQRDTQGNPVKDSSGNYVRNETRYPTTPKPSSGGSSGGGSSGGGSSGGSGSSSKPNPIQQITQAPSNVLTEQIKKTQQSSVQSTPQQRAQADFQKQQAEAKKEAQRVRAFIESEKARDILSSREQSKTTAETFNLPYKEDVFSNAYYKNVESKVKSTNVNLKDIQKQGDNRGTISTILGLGEKPVLSGKEVIYGTEKLIEKEYKEIFDREFNQAINEKTKIEEKNINLSNYQQRILAGENYDIVNAEYEAEVKKANERINEYANEWANQWYNRRGKYLDKAGVNVLDATNVVYSAKDTQAKVGSYFGKGAVFGGAATGGSLAVGAIGGATTAAVVGTVGLVAGAGYAVYSFGKAGYTGYKQYEKSLDVGASKKDALQRALVGGSTDIAPAAFGAAGALVGGGIVYGATIGSKAAIGKINLKRLETAKPEVSVGLKKGIDGKDVLLVASRKKAQGLFGTKLNQDTLVKFDTFKVGDKVYQVQAGKGTTSVTTKNIFGRTSNTQEQFTFFGKAYQTQARYVKGGLSQPIKQDTSISELKVLTKNLKATDVRGAGFSKTDGTITRFISGDTSNTGRLYINKDGGVSFVNLDTQSVINIPRGDVRVVFNPKGVGFIKDIGSGSSATSASGKTIQVFGGDKTTPATIATTAEKGITQSLNIGTTSQGYGNSNVFAGAISGSNIKSNIFNIGSSSDFLQGVQALSPEKEVSASLITGNAVKVNNQETQKLETKQTESFSINPLQSLVLDRKQEEKVNLGITSVSRTSTISSQKPTIKQQPIFKQPQIELQKDLQVTKQVTKQITKQQPIQQNIFNRGFFPGEVRPQTPKIKEQTPFGFDLPKKKTKEGQKAFSTFVLIDATKPTARWIKVADKVPYESALGFGAKFVSQDISARFKVEEEEGEAKDVYNPFWQQLGSRFRGYMVKKGTKIQQENVFIERASFRLSSKKEKQQIQSARNLIMGGR